MFVLNHSFVFSGKAGTRAQWDGPVRESGTEIDAQGRGNEMPASGQRRGEGRRADAVKTAGAVGLRGRRAAALDAVDRVTARRRLDRAVQAGGRIHDQADVQGA